MTVGFGLIAAIVTLGLGILAAQSTEFLDFDNGLNALPSNVLQVDSEVLPNCQDYPACDHHSDVVYTAYFREWFVQPTDRFELWVVLLMTNPVVDVVESVVLLTHVSEWTSAAQHNNTVLSTGPASPSAPRPVCGACVHVLAIGLALRALVVMVAVIYNWYYFDTTIEPHLPEHLREQLQCLNRQVWWWWGQQIVCAVLWQLGMAVYQANLLRCYCTASVAARWYGVALFFSFVPGIAVMPVSEWLLLQSSCNVLDAANAQLFLLAPLVGGIVLSCIVVVAMVYLVVDCARAHTNTELC